MQITRESPLRFDESWFVIGRSESVRSTPLARFVFNEPIVLVRNQEGLILALQDRCPHQGVPLSQGRLGPKGLMCRYHGWSFDSRGHCNSIPGSPAESVNEIRVQSYQIQELDGWVWISRSPSAAPPPLMAAMAARKQSIFLWEKMYLQPVSQRLPADSCLAAGSVTHLTIRAPLGCQARIALCVTPETQVSSRVFACAQIESRWLPQWLARMLVMPRLVSHANPQALLGSDLPA